MLAKVMSLGALVMDWSFVVMKNLLEIMRLVFPVMIWLAKVMARNEKVTGFLARFFSDTCSVPVPEERILPRAVLRGECSWAHINVKIRALAMSAIPDKKVEQLQFFESHIS